MSKSWKKHSKEELRLLVTDYRITIINRGGCCKRLDKDKDSRQKPRGRSGLRQSELDHGARP
jgi:hypothetical protein